MNSPFLAGSSVAAANTPQGWHVPIAAPISTETQTALDAKVAKGTLMFNVRDYGAVGDGVADDTAEIQAAIDAAAAANGGIVFLPAGTYKVTAALSGGHGLNIQGVGKGQSWINAALGTAIIKGTNTATRYFSWTLRDFGVDNTSRNTVGGLGIDLANISTSRVDNVVCTNVETGIRLDGSAYYNQFSSMQITTAVTAVKYSAAVAGGGGNENEWDNLRIGDVTTGVVLDNASNNVFVKPAIEGFTGIGFDIGANQSVTGTTIAGPRLENVPSVGTGIRNRSNGASTMVIGGVYAGLSSDIVNDNTATQMIVLQPGIASSHLNTDKLLLASGGSSAAQIYASGGEVLIRNNTGAADYPLKASQVTAVDGVLLGSPADAAVFRGAANQVKTNDDFFCNTYVTAVEGVYLGNSTDTVVYRSAAATLTTTSDVSIATAGKGLKVKEGSNAKMGTATLVGGAATVSTTAVTATSRIYLTSNTDGGTPGWLRVSARTAGTSFTITSSSGSDTSTVAWLILEPA